MKKKKLQFNGEGLKYKNTNFLVEESILGIGGNLISEDE